MEKKTALVTGANSGMGFAAAKILAKKGWHVVLLCRSLEKGRAAVKEIQKGGQSAELLVCDLANLADIRAAAARFQKSHARLDALVNNAAVIGLKRQETADGFEQQFGVNYLGHFLFTLLLLPLLENSPDGRIVSYSSGAYRVGRIHFDDLQLTRCYNAVKAYSQSKLACLLFARAMAARLAAQGSGVRINACHPGAVATQLGMDRKTGFGKTLLRLLKPFFLTPEQGAATAVYLAAAKEARRYSGLYFYKCKPKKTSARGRDMQTAQKLFIASEKLTKEYYPPQAGCQAQSTV